MDHEHVFGVDDHEHLLGVEHVFGLDDNEHVFGLDDNEHLLQQHLFGLGHARLLPCHSLCAILGHTKRHCQGRRLQ